VSRLEALESKLSAHPLWSDTSLLPRLIALQHKEALASAARAARKELKAAQVGGGRREGEGQGDVIGVAGVGLMGWLVFVLTCRYCGCLVAYHVHRVYHVVCTSDVTLSCGSICAYVGCTCHVTLSCGSI